MKDSENARLKELRDLLVGPERSALRRRLDRLEDPNQQKELLAHLLPGAIEKRSASDDRLIRSLRTTVEKILQRSVKRNPEVLIQALFPLIGPAIRKAVRASLSNALQNLQQALDRSLSFRAIGWRIESFRSGRPFSEIVLLHTLRFRVEQVLLIHRESGLLIQNVVAGGVGSRDPELVSGMLTAIQDFGRDSFQVDSDDTLESFNLGDLIVWLEQGPHAMLAAVIRGRPPAELRVQMQETLEAVHLEKGLEMANFQGDSTRFETVVGLLEECLMAEMKEPPRKGISPQMVVVGSLLLVLLLGWAGLEIRDHLRWSRFTDLLSRQPGILLTEAEKSGDTIRLAGLRDPLALEPQALLEDSDLSFSELDEKWEPFFSFHPDFTLARVNRSLAPPPEVDLSVEDGTLKATGVAEGRWIADARRLAPLLPGISAVDFSELVDKGDQILREKSEPIERMEVVYPRGSSQLPPSQLPQVDRLVSLLRDLRDELLRLDRSMQLVIQGQNDEGGSAALNRRLRQTRAENLRNRLVAADLDRPPLTLEIADADAGATSDLPGVTFRLRSPESGQ